MNRKIVFTFIVSGVISVGLIGSGFAQTVPAAPAAGSVQNMPVEKSATTGEVKKKITKKEAHLKPRKHYRKIKRSSHKKIHSKKKEVSTSQPPVNN